MKMVPRMAHRSYRMDGGDLPAAIRFLSCEPLIGSLAGIDLRHIH